MNTSIKDFIDIGDPGAPIGSPPWCQAAHLQLCATKRQADWKVRHLKIDLREFKDKERWKQLPGNKGRPFQSWKQYVETPEPNGLGMALESVDAVLEALDDKLIGQVLGTHGGDRRSQSAKDNQVDNIKLKGGTQADYLRARLKRDAPEIYSRLTEFRSVRDAAIVAKIIKVPTPLDRLRNDWKKASTEERETFLKEVISRSDTPV
jgi:hypothetical protein